MTNGEQKILFELAPGLYRLRAPVDNIHGDGRKKYGWTELSKFPAGLYWVEEEPEPFDDGHPHLRLRHITLIYTDSRRESGFTYTVNTARGLVSSSLELSSAAVLAAALEPDNSLAALLRLCDGSTVTECYRLVLRLVKDGAISEETIRKTLAAMGDGE